MQYDSQFSYPAYGRGTPILREDVRSPAAALDLDSFVLAQNESPVYGQNLHSHVDSLKAHLTSSLFHLDQTMILPFNQHMILKLW
jgi:hypothetical protein